ncbi:acyl-CoA dehydrogenase domain protein [Luminiphilus syltensis NOR5-1B]|uniref:Acyl-CoA dehydrogenase domain protein n=1 Tax=Luminiphilus syltensis NOR5-1B TaxID=565045 RepID=B8KSR3_9GAMM|nr:acyl-CoA dehydrogenase family protein [Luminiphilus syltensis]EED35347.1 acyl-CoA dehydrogenase domain protein [Luminiphilus syltensis NOR5-1B]
MTDYAAFRLEVRQFLEASLTPELRRAGKLTTSVFSDFESSMAWQRILHAKGWAAPDWPEEYGGPGWDIHQRYIFQEECKLANAPSIIAMGIQMLGPLLMKYGTEAQKTEIIPRILSGDDVWCQGYSEPGAGSDLASLKTTAERDGDHYRVNGTKIWTSLAQHSNKIFCLVRTNKDVKPQAGISFLLMDIDLPGITIDPIVSLDGQVEQCQVFFEDVEVPVTNLVGDENDGWSVAKSLLEFERGGHNFTIDIKKQLGKVRDQALRIRGRGGRPKLEDPVFRTQLAEAEIEAMALEQTELRIKGSFAAGGNPGALSSLVKAVGTELSQQFNELSVDAVGRAITPYFPEGLDPHFEGETPVPDYATTTMAEYINNRSATIYGGTAEVQRNIIAKQILKL